MFVLGRGVFEERPKQTKVFDDFGNVKGAKIIVRHEVEVSLDLIGEIGRQLSRDGRL